MSNLTHIKKIERLSPALLDVLKAAITGGQDIYEYNSHANYAAGTYVYRFNNNTVLIVYKSNTNVVGTGLFDLTEWDVVDGLGNYSGIVISYIEPDTNEVDCWFKPLSYAMEDVNSLAMEIDPALITYNYRYNNSDTLYTLANLPVGSSPENTHGVAMSVGTATNATGIRSISMYCDCGYPIMEINENMFTGNTNLTGFYLNHIQTVGANAFKDCTNLGVLNMGSVKTIAENAFENIKIVSAVFPTTCTNVAADAFTGCAYLTTATFNNPNTVIHTDAFSNTSITTIKGYSGSTAEVFATLKSLTFEDISAP